MCGIGALSLKEAITLRETTPEGRRFHRRRQANYAGGRPIRHVVKVSPKEEAILFRLATQQRVSIARVLVESALASEHSETPTERHDTIVELFKLHRLLGAVSNNVNQIAKVANSTGEIGEDLKATLAMVREVAGRIDQACDELSLT